MFKLLAIILFLILIILFFLNKIFKNLLIERFKNKTFVISLLLIVLVVLSLSFMFYDRNKTGTYTPPTFDGNKVIPGKVINE